MNLTDLAGKGISVASLLHLCSKNATVNVDSLGPISTPDAINDALIAFGIDHHPYWAKLTYELIVALPQ